MIQITATDLKTKLGKYLDLATHEDIHITKNGSDIALLTKAILNTSWVDEISGIISNKEINEKLIKEERLIKKYESLD